LESYIKGMQLKFEDAFTYGDFEALAKAMHDPKPDASELKQSLEDEGKLSES
jgi:hypothetical protein